MQVLTYGGPEAARCRCTRLAGLTIASPIASLRSPTFGLKLEPTPTENTVPAVTYRIVSFVFFQAEDGIRDWSVTGVQTCALPICTGSRRVLASGPFRCMRVWCTWTSTRRGCKNTPATCAAITSHSTQRYCRLCTSL